MVREAEHYAEQDKKRRDEVDKLNNADSLCYQAEKTLADYGDKITEELKSRINSAVSDTKDAIKKKDATLATERADKLKAVLQEVGKKLYEQTAASTPRSGPTVSEPTGEARPSGSGPHGRVVDAEFKAEKQP
jgi:molecular chaperone DnaK